MLFYLKVRITRAIGLHDNENHIESLGIALSVEGWLIGLD